MTRAFVLGAALFLGSEAFADDAQDAAANFYRNYLVLRQSEKMTGIPNEAQLERLAPLITPELSGLFRRALREQRRCAKQFPGDKPPWIEGDIFSSHFEGFTSFKAGPGTARNEATEVKVKFRYAEGASTVTWTDRLVLRNSAGQWRVGDVKYRGKFAFTSGFGTSLRKSLKRIPAC